MESVRVYELVKVPAAIFLAFSIILGCDSVDTTLVAPSELTATAATDALAIDLAWSESPGATAYRVYRATLSFERVGSESDGDATDVTEKRDPGRKKPRRVPTLKFAPLAETGAEAVAEVATPSFRDEQVSAGIRYYYRVTALRDHDESAPSNMASAIAGAGTTIDSDADIATYKNTPVSVTLSTNAVDATTVAYAVVTQPTNGTAIVTGTTLWFAPNDQFVGFDAVIMQANSAVTAALSIEVINRLPVIDKAPSISTLVNTSDSSQIVASDPDPNDPVTFTVAAAANGIVSIDAVGLLDYAPVADFTGADSVVVTVWDGSGASTSATVQIAVGFIALPTTQLHPAVHTSLCSSGVNRASIIDVEPPAGTLFASGSAPTVTATISYALSTTTAIGFKMVGGGNRSGGNIWGGANHTVSVAPGCGVTDVTVTLNVPAGNFDSDTKDGDFNAVMVSIPDGLRGPQFFAGDVTYVGSFTFEGTSLPPGTVVDDLFVDFYAEVGWDLDDFDETALPPGDWYYSGWVEINDWFGQGNWYPYIGDAPQAGSGQKVRMRTAPACNDKWIELVGYAATQVGDKVVRGAEYGESAMIYPLKPQKLSVSWLIEHFPIANSDAVVKFELKDCIGIGGPVELRPSANWMALDTTWVTLNYSPAITLIAANMTPGLNEGYIDVIPANGAFTTVRIPISAKKFAYDLNQFTFASCVYSCSNRDDDAYSLPLPFAFPISGTTTSVLYGNSNGTLHMMQSGPYFISSDYNQMLRSFDHYAPYAWGGPVFAFWFADNIMETAAPGVPQRLDNTAFVIQGGYQAPGYYYRTLGENFEVIAWNLQSISGYSLFNVMRLLIKPNGTIDITYDQALPTGFEDIASYSAKGVRSQAVDPWSIEQGQTITFGPIGDD